jgi:hypothetical protein
MSRTAYLLCLNKRVANLNSIFRHNLYTATRRDDVSSGELAQFTFCTYFTYPDGIDALRDHVLPMGHVQSHCIIG